MVLGYFPFQSTKRFTFSRRKIAVLEPLLDRIVLSFLSCRKLEIRHLAARNVRVKRT